MSEKPLPEWPTEPNWDEICDQTEMNGEGCEYYRALYEAAMARLRKLANAAGVVAKNTNEAYGIQALRNALSAIGPLPDVPEGA